MEQTKTKNEANRKRLVPHLAKIESSATVIDVNHLIHAGVIYDAGAKIYWPLWNTATSEAFTK